MTLTMYMDFRHLWLRQIREGRRPVPGLKVPARLGQVKSADKVDNLISV